MLKDAGFQCIRTLTGIVGHQRERLAAVLPRTVLPRPLPHGPLGRWKARPHQRPPPHLSCRREQPSVCLQLTERLRCRGTPRTFVPLPLRASISGDRKLGSSLGPTAVPPSHREAAALHNNLLKLPSQGRKCTMWKMKPGDRRQQLSGTGRRRLLTLKGMGPPTGQSEKAGSTHSSNGAQADPHSSTFAGSVRGTWSADPGVT